MPMELLEYCSRSIVHQNGVQKVILHSNRVQWLSKIEANIYLMFQLKERLETI